LSERFDFFIPKLLLPVSLGITALIILIANIISQDTAIIVGNYLYIPIQVSLLVTSIWAIRYFGLDGIHGLGWLAFLGFAAELNNAVGVNVETIFEKLVLTSHATSCTSPTGPCNPGKGGISVSHQGSTGNGNTIGFKALHQNYGYGFIIAKHEVPNGNEQVVQPKSSSNIIGVTQAIGGSRCDCAFIQLSGGHSMVDSIWAPDLGSIYPVQARNTSFTPAGTILTWDGLGSTAHIGSLAYENDIGGKVSGTSSPGDSGSAVFKPQANGNADVYGITMGTFGGYTFYEPYDHIKSQLGLQW